MFAERLGNVVAEPQGVYFYISWTVSDDMLYMQAANIIAGNSCGVKMGRLSVCSVVVSLTRIVGKVLES